MASALNDDDVRKAAAKVYAVLVLIAVAAIAAVLLVAGLNPQANTLQFEVAKTALQVIGVAVIGGVLTLATSTYQGVRKLRDEQQQKIKDQESEARIDRERKIEALRVERERKDDAIRATMQATLATYNSVKRVRRLIKAQVRGGIERSSYDEYLSRIIDLQLEFEQYARLAPFIADERLRPPEAPDQKDPDFGPRPAYKSLQQSYRSIESYLNGLIREYEKKRPTEEATATIPLDDLPKLAELCKASSFVPGVSYHIDDVVGGLADSASAES